MGKGYHAIFLNIYICINIYIRYIVYDMYHFYESIVRQVLQLIDAGHPNSRPSDDTLVQTPRETAPPQQRKTPGFRHVMGNELFQTLRIGGVNAAASRCL